MRYTFLLCLVSLSTIAACGAPFETSHYSSAEGGSSPEAGKDVRGNEAAQDAPCCRCDVLLHPEASCCTCFISEGGHDADRDVAPPVDAAPVDAALVDAGHDSSLKDVASPPDTGCTPFGTATVLCPDTTAISTTPTNYCVYDSTSGVSSLAATPAECQCKGTYACACIEASVAIPAQLCKSTQVYAGCSMVGGAPLVTCEDP
jgi:hypothetical protein